MAKEVIVSNARQWWVGEAMLNKLRQQRTKKTWQAMDGNGGNERANAAAHPQGPIQGTS